MEEQIFLHGIALRNYKGIGAETAFIAPLKRFNFFIGSNNSGKSCVLDFISRHLKNILEANKIFNHENLKPLDIHLGATQTDVLISIGFPAEFIESEILKKEGIPDLLKHRYTKIIDTIKKQGCVWFTKDEPYFKALKNFDQDFLEENLSDQIKEFLDDRTEGFFETSLVDEVASIIDWASYDFLTAKTLITSDINMIPAIREISAKGQKFVDWSGKGLIEEIAKLQNPGVHNRQELLKFKRINKFLKTVTETESAEIEIPFDREHILVHMHGKTLPIESLGTGIHEVVMLAAFCTLAENQIVCIEEPELHLHPILQRRLVKYLEDNTTNQYFIATHSASIIDMVDASIFHVSNVDGCSKIELCLTSNNKSNVLQDLGYKASDLLQANSIIWVEGPSDRVYIKHWLSQAAPELVEGIDYSIMFYGGRLLSHLSASDAEPSQEDLDALIAVRRLNRNLAIVIDSDRASAKASVNETKRRIQEEVEQHGGIVWITAGREIENYVPTDTMTEALKAAYKKFDARLKTGQYDHVLPFKTTEDKTFKDVDKVKVAKLITESGNCDCPLDLKEKIQALVEMIRKANR